jgi:RNA polymerase sigma factor (sigma-70 family)
VAGPSDRELLEAVREGDDEAYAQLWRRHHPAALRAARQFDHSTEAEDIAAEAFARVLNAVRQGNGPHEAFRAYLLRAVSNVAQNAARSRRGLGLGQEGRQYTPVESTP